MENRHLAAIGVGGNATSTCGSPDKTAISALRQLSAAGFGLVAVSRFYRSPAFPPGSGDDFVNAAAILSTDLPPDAVLERLHETEASHGRVRTQRWGPRTLDLDLLLLGDTVLPDAATQTVWRSLSPDRQRTDTPGCPILPHPRLQDRAFVLLPLAEIASGWRHPVTGRTVGEMCAALEPASKRGVVPL